MDVGMELDVNDKCINNNSSIGKYFNFVYNIFILLLNLRPYHRESLFLTQARYFIVYKKIKIYDDCRS